MPIKGLTDRGLAFPEIGQIRKGMKVEHERKGKRYEAPMDLKYFRVLFDEREQEAAAVFLKHYGERPEEIDILLPFDELDRMWEAWLEAYTAGRMVARSDGEIIIYRVDTKTGKPVVLNGLNLETNRVEPYYPDMVVGMDYQNKPVQFRPVGRLKVVLPVLGRAAYMTVITGSKIDIINISNQLAALKAINAGRISGIPLVLRRRPRKISVPSPDNPTQRVRMEKWILSIEADPSWVRRLLTQMNRLASPEANLLLPQGSEQIVETTWDELSEPGEPGYEAEVNMKEVTEIEDGNKVDVIEEPDDDLIEPEPVLAPSSRMSYETAETVKNREGVRYVDLPDDRLAYMARSLEKYLKKPELGEEEREEKQFKLDACRVILAHRAGK